MDKKSIIKEIAQKLGRLGYKACLASSTEEQRKEWRRKGGKNRWKNKKKK